MYKSLTFVLFIAALSMSCSGTRPIRSVAGRQSVASMERVTLGGYPQFVLIRGHDLRNPVLLFLHGGPGAAETPLFRKFNGDLEKDFTVVYWDQRGAGKSYSKNLDLSTITLRRNIDDAHELVEYLKKRFGKEKIFLVGHSWGTKLGMHVVKERPSNFYAFVATGQEVESARGELQSYRYTLEQAEKRNHKKALQDLTDMGEPKGEDYNGMYKTGFWGLVVQKKWLLKMGGERYAKTNYLDWVKHIWLSREYTFGDLIRWSKGSATTAGQMLKDPMFAGGFNFFEEIPSIDVPVIFVSGLHDYNTPWPLVKEYYEFVKTPSKEFILFEKSGHSPPFEEPERFNTLIREKFAPFRIDLH